MNVCVKKSDICSEYFFDEGCHIIEISNSGDDPDVSIARARVEPGVTTKWHRLRETSERYLIMSGSGFVEIGDQRPVMVSAGDVVLIPAMCRQRISNIGPEDLIFFAVCTPPFKKSIYEECRDQETGTGI
ncbi:cupin domain-containing protein [Desulforegula conservatrix]|uniref:cupin domain-containing protein n=1 Tax=Desulforegula conservatrix TaxID=153026 RepID=UPI000400D187|nr:cupin domain-containing protein [Desulforegula conservatrix]